jgi:hypothetical protein
MSSLRDWKTPVILIYNNVIPSGLETIHDSQPIIMSSLRD